MKKLIIMLMLLSSVSFAGIEDLPAEQQISLRTFFTQTLVGGDEVIILYDDKCKHCKKVIQEFELARDLLNNQVRFVFVNLSENVSLRKGLKIKRQGLPVTYLAHDRMPLLALYPYAKGKSLARMLARLLKLKYAKRGNDVRRRRETKTVINPYRFAY